MKVSPTAQHEFTRSRLITDEHLVAFGHLIVRACIHNREFFEVAKVIVDYDGHRQDYSRNDFLAGDVSDSDSVIYSGMLDFAAHHVQNNPWPSNQTEWLQAILPHVNRMFERNPSWPESYKENAFMALVLNYPPPAVGEYDLVYDGLVDYVLGVRQKKVMMGLKNVDPATKQKMLDEVRTTMRIPGQETVLVTADQHFEALLGQTTRTHTFRTGVKAFDRHYGDFAAPGDYWTISGLPGGGKTVAACQIAGSTAALGRKVLHISTEVQAKTCLLRACAANQGISYEALNAIKGSGQAEATDLGIQFRTWIQQVGCNITAVDYGTTSGATFEDKMKSILDMFYRVHGQQPELVLFDWIGAACGKEFPDAWAKSNHYDQVSQYFKELADDLEIVTFAFAQASKETNNKVDIAESQTAWCKSINDHAEGALFLTSLREPHQEGQDMEQAAYQDRQYWVVPKCRDREARKIPVLRRFNMQRFDDCR